MERLFRGIGVIGLMALTGCSAQMNCNAVLQDQTRDAQSDVTQLREALARGYFDSPNPVFLLCLTDALDGRDDVTDAERDAVFQSCAPDPTDAFVQIKDVSAVQARLAEAERNLAYYRTATCENGVLTGDRAILE